MDREQLGHFLNGLNDGMNVYGMSKHTFDAKQTPTQLQNQLQDCVIPRFVEDGVAGLRHAQISRYLYKLLKGVPVFVLGVCRCCTLVFIVRLAPKM